MAAVKLADVLRAGKDDKFKPADADSKTEEVHDFDIGHLMVLDQLPVDAAELAKGPAEHLLRSTRDSVQLLFNKLFSMPTAPADVGRLVHLPPPKMRLPRAKKLPEMKELTTWQKFAKEKGIMKRKKDRFVWDADSKEWKARFGYNRVDGPEKDWVIEAKPTDDGQVDPFLKKQEEKRGRVAANKMQQKRNELNANPELVKQINQNDKEVTKRQVDRALSIVSKSTASIGKFDERLPGEGKTKVSGARKKYDPVTGQTSEEKKKSLSYLDQVLGKETKATLSVQKAAKAKLGDMERQGAFDDKPGKKSGAVKKIEKKVHSIQKKRMKGKGGKTAVRKI